MPVVYHNLRLNSMLILLRCSLVQYAAECWPWSSRDAVSARQAVLGAAAEQTTLVEQMAALLTDRGWSIDPGAYPEEFTDWNFVSLRYLWPRVIEDQEFVVAELAEAAHECVDDRQGTRLLTAARDSQRLILEGLRVASASVSAS
ncbi:hypothetical protein [Planctellipticum variicoloris]|uniref:hypothetical protein n=1 Tax=Planctellipticum variicoloris TaxID=3064265 RepID=UPI0030134C48|nr:hypothetical protein SH412_002376 [Planctomycetaceae bacterium SH412]